MDGCSRAALFSRARLFNRAALSNPAVEFVLDYCAGKTIVCTASFMIDCYSVTSG
jgi:hypothetical protein